MALVSDECPTELVPASGLKRKSVEADKRINGQDDKGINVIIFLTSDFQLTTHFLRFPTHDS